MVRGTSASGGCNHDPPRAGPRSGPCTGCSHRLEERRQRNAWGRAEEKEGLHADGHGGTPRQIESNDEQTTQRDRETGGGLPPPSSGFSEGSLIRGRRGSYVKGQIYSSNRKKLLDFQL